MTEPAAVPARRRARPRTIAAWLAAGAVLFSFTDAPYADVAPGPTPALAELVVQENAGGDIDPSFGRGGEWHVTTINATPLKWWELARCEVTGDCQVFPLATGSSTRDAANQSMLRSERDAAALAATWVGASDHDITMTADLGEVGGPSAGTMLTLAFIDAATDGDLTGGRVIAGTGTINSLSEVGPVSGVKFKVAGAVKAGAEVFFVPHLKADEAFAAAKGTDIEVVAVSHLPEALAWLCDNGGQSTVCDSPALREALAMYAEQGQL